MAGKTEILVWAWKLPTWAGGFLYTWCARALRSRRK
jgi:hypothetical protein